MLYLGRTLACSRALGCDSAPHLTGAPRREALVEGLAGSGPRGSCTCTVVAELVAAMAPPTLAAPPSREGGTSGLAAAAPSRGAAAAVQAWELLRGGEATGSWE